MPSLDSVTFDTTGLRLEDESGESRVWRSPAGDGVGLYHIPLRPDIGADLQSIDEVRRFYRVTVADSGGAIIEVDTRTLSGCTAVRVIVKVQQQQQQQPHGMTYVGSITLPFRDFSFVAKAQCEERGTAGVRDSVVMDEALREGRVMIDAETQLLQGWMCDPYDSTLGGGFHRNLSEAPEYDERFPDHPLSRLRRIMRQIESTLSLADEMRSEPPYVWNDLS
jgi:hypothetical protein